MEIQTFFNFLFIRFRLSRRVKEKTRKLLRLGSKNKELIFYQAEWKAFLRRELCRMMKWKRK